MKADNSTSSSLSGTNKSNIDGRAHRRRSRENNCLPTSRNRYSIKNKIIMMISYTHLLIMVISHRSVSGYLYTYHSSLLFAILGLVISCIIKGKQLLFGIGILIGRHTISFNRHFVRPYLVVLAICIVKYWESRYSLSIPRHMMLMVNLMLTDIYIVNI